MAWLTGAIRKEVTRHRTLMARHDGVCNHIAVSNGLSLFNYFNQDGSPTSHFYVRKAGPRGEDAGLADFEQYVDTRYRAPANLEGNHRLISIETQGGVGDDLNAGWTVAQLNRLAWIAAECHRIHGIPLQAMANSLSTTRGIGYHRLGVDPWRVSGGERWSSAYGKVCPGSARIAQQPRIITLAREYATPTQEDDMPYTPEQLRAMMQAENEEYGGRLWAQSTGTGAKFIASTEAGFASLGTKLDAVTAAIEANTEELRTWIASLYNASQNGTEGVWHEQDVARGNQILDAIATVRAELMDLAAAHEEPSPPLA